MKLDEALATFKDGQAIIRKGRPEHEALLVGTLKFKMFAEKDGPLNNPVLDAMGNVAPEDLDADDWELLIEY